MQGAHPDPAPQNIRTRRMFFIPGFDPMPARRYRELYRSEGMRQATLSGYNLDIKAGPGDGPYSWDVTAQIDGQITRTQVEFLGWGDLVREAMDIPIPQSFAQMGRTVWLYLRSGALAALFGLRPGPMITAFYPVAMLLGQLALGLLAALMAWRLLAPVSPLLAAPLALAALAAVMIFLRRIDARVYAYYLMHDYAYFASHAGATPQPLARRMAEFEARIVEARASDTDDVLIVGHSTGAQIAVQIAASILRREPAGKPLSLLTLGQVIPMISFLPDAQDLRRDLAFLSANNNLTWADVSAPGDGACFALCDPVQVSGVAPEHARWPRTISAAFSQTLSKETLRRTRWRFFRLHLQYLCAFEMPRSYDYFRFTAGPQSLAALLETRHNSPSRITTPRSPYRDVAP